MHSKALTSALVDKLRAAVHMDSPAGFVIFWYLVFYNPAGKTYEEKMYLPFHCLEWVAKFYWAKDHGYPAFALEAFRGSLKSTIFTLALNAYRLGIYPHKEILIAQANDTSAAENTEFVSSLVEDSPGYGILFPGVVPDKSKGWGAQGYEIKDDTQSYGIWRRLRTKVPSLLGAGYKSASILGKHPRLHGVLDDVSTFKNTRSPREKDALVKTVEKEIRPALDKVDMTIDVFTPWGINDPGDIQKKKTSTYHVRTPIYRLDEDGNLTDIPTWPEVWPEEKIKVLRENTPPAEFAQMYLVSVEAAQGQHLKGDWLWPYPHEEIDPEWRRVLAVDYASVGKKSETRDRDYFAMAQYAIHPNRFAILETGYHGHLLPAECEDVVLNWGTRLGGRLLTCAIETQGKGENFYHWMLANAPFKVKEVGPGNKDKGTRFEMEMAPLYKNGKARISDNDNDPFLKEFRQEWLAFDGLDTYFDDCLDAGYYGLKVVRHILKPTVGERLVGAITQQSQYQNPIFKGFGKR